MKIPFQKENEDFWRLVPTMLEGLITKRMIKNKKDEKIWEDHYLKEIRNKTKQKKETQRKPITASLRHEVFKRDDYTCQECGNTRKETALEVDHIIPVSQGGTDEMDNLRTLCLRCNRDKGNRSW